MVRFECRLRFGPGLRRSMGGDAHATVHGRDARATRVARAVWAGVEVGEAEEEVGGAAGLVVVFVVEEGDGVGGVGVGGVGGVGGGDWVSVVIVEHGAEGGDGFVEVGGGEGAGAEGGEVVGLGEEGFALVAGEEEGELVEGGVEAGRDVLEGLGGVEQEIEQVCAREGLGGC